MEKYKFPENNWYIEIDDDNRELVNNWKIKTIYNQNLIQYPDLKYVDLDGCGLNTEIEALGKYKITTEQFRQYVLKQLYKFKIRDKVKLLKAKKTWTGEWGRDWEEGFVDQNPIVEITKITIEEGKTCIQFKNSGNWQWSFEDGHFELYKEYVEDYSYLEKIFKQLRIK
jgi:hypothetical protein